MFRFRVLGVSFSNSKCSVLSFRVRKAGLGQCVD